MLKQIRAEVQNGLQQESEAKQPLSGELKRGFIAYGIGAVATFNAIFPVGNPPAVVHGSFVALSLGANIYGGLKVASTDERLNRVTKPVNAIFSNASSGLFSVGNFTRRQVDKGARQTARGARALVSLAH